MHTILVESSMPESRRRFARLFPTSDVHVQIAGLALTLELRDLSLGGFAIVASRPFWRGMTHRFTFSTSGLEINLVAKAVHCHAVPQDGERKFITGWEFMAGSADRTEAAIGHLFAAATDAPPPPATAG